MSYVICVVFNSVYECVHTYVARLDLASRIIFFYYYYYLRAQVPSVPFAVGTTSPPVGMHSAPEHQFDILAKNRPCT